MNTKQDFLNIHKERFLDLLNKAEVKGFEYAIKALAGTDAGDYLIEHKDQIMKGELQ